MNEARRPVETPIVETPVEARAGFLDRPVLVVLCVSLALGIVVLGALWFRLLRPERLTPSMPRQHGHFGGGRQARL